MEQIIGKIVSEDNACICIIVILLLFKQLCFTW